MCQGKVLLVKASLKIACAVESWKGSFNENKKYFKTTFYEDLKILYFI